MMIFARFFNKLNSVTERYTDFRDIEFTLTFCGQIGPSTKCHSKKQYLNLWHKFRHKNYSLKKKESISGIQRRSRSKIIRWMNHSTRCAFFFPRQMSWHRKEETESKRSSINIIGFIDVGREKKKKRFSEVKYRMKCINPCKKSVDDVSSNSNSHDEAIKSNRISKTKRKTKMYKY